MLFTFVMYFSLIGVFCLLRNYGMPTLGFLVFMLPICMIATFTLFIRPIVSEKTVKVFSHIANKGFHQRVHATLLALYFVVIAIGFARSIDAGSRKFTFGIAEILIFLVIPTFFYAVITTYIHNKSSLLLKGIVTSMFIYLVINIVGAFIGLEANVMGRVYTREFENIFGFSNFRIIFPFNMSGQLLSASAGVVFTCASLHLFGNRRWYDLFMVCSMIAASLVIIFGHGARGPVMAIPIVMLFGIAWKQIRRYLGFAVIIMTVVLPLLFVYTDMGSVFMRALVWSGFPLVRNADAFTPLSNREIIWSSVFSEFSHFEWIHIIGFGAYGQVTSGIISMFAYLFSNSYKMPYSASVHNTYLQVLVDYGYIGLILFISILFSLFVLISRFVLRGGNRRYEKIIVLVLVYILSVSTMEPCLTYYSIELWSLFTFINIYVLLDPQSPSKLN